MAFRKRFFKDRVRERAVGYMINLLFFWLVSGGFWLGIKIINLLVPTCLGSIVCGQYAVNFFHSVGVSYPQNSLSIWLRIWLYIAAAAAKSLQWCLTLCDPMDCSLPSFSIHGILQARPLEWVAISFSSWGNRGLQPRVTTGGSRRRSGELYPAILNWRQFGQCLKVVTIWGRGASNG